MFKVEILRIRYIVRRTTIQCTQDLGLRQSLIRDVFYKIKGAQLGQKIIIEKEPTA